MATSNPNVPTDRKGRGKPPMLYNADPNAGPMIYRFLSFNVKKEGRSKDDLEVLSSNHYRSYLSCNRIQITFQSMT